MSQWIKIFPSKNNLLAEKILKVAEYKLHLLRNRVKLVKFKKKKQM
jgi:hypothetical protein